MRGVTPLTFKDFLITVITHECQQRLVINLSENSDGESDVESLDDSECSVEVFSSEAETDVQPVFCEISSDVEEIS